MSATCALLFLSIFAAPRFRNYDTLLARLRRHRWAWVRATSNFVRVYSFAWRLERVCRALPPPGVATAAFVGGGQVLENILADGPDTYQKKSSNRAQIESLLECVCSMLPRVLVREQAVPVVLDLGAGKALLTRAVYEALERRVPVVAFDCRRESSKDRFYDPPPQQDAAAAAGAALSEAPYTRVVGDVSDLGRLELALPDASRGGVVALAKHLCGGATDSSLVAMCAPPLSEYVGACCIAPCCHQKARPADYCNRPFLAACGFGADASELTRRGTVSELNFRTLQMLVQISKAEREVSTMRRRRRDVTLLVSLRTLGVPSPLPRSRIVTARSGSRRCKKLTGLPMPAVWTGRLRVVQEVEFSQGPWLPPLLCARPARAPLARGRAASLLA